MIDIVTAGEVLVIENTKVMTVVVMEVVEEIEMIIGGKAEVHLVDQIMGVLSHKKRRYLMNAKNLFFSLEPNLLK